MFTLKNVISRVALILLVGAMCVNAQTRDIGKRRANGDEHQGRTSNGDVGRSGSTVTAPANPAPPPRREPSPPPTREPSPSPPVYVPTPPPPVVIIYPTLDPVEPAPVVMETPRRQQFEIWDFHTFPLDAGFDFSGEVVCAAGDNDADIMFERNGDDPLFNVPQGVEIADLGVAGRNGQADEHPNAGWSEAGYVYVMPGHAYLVQTAEGKQFRIVVDELLQRAVQCSWVCVDHPSSARPRISPVVTRAEQSYFPR